MERFRKQNTQQDARILSGQKSSTNSFLVITFSLFSCKGGIRGVASTSLTETGTMERERRGKTGQTNLGSSADIDILQVILNRKRRLEHVTRVT